MWKTFTMQWIKLIHHFFSIALLQNRSDWLIRNNWRPSVCPFAEKCAHVYLFFCAKTQIMQKRFLENLKSSYILSVGSTNCIWRPPKFRFSKSACVGASSIIDRQFTARVKFAYFCVLFIALRRGRNCGKQEKGSSSRELRSSWIYFFAVVVYVRIRILRKWIAWGRLRDGWWR